MKVTFFIQNLGFGGAQRATTNLANCLVRKDFEITIVVMSETPTSSYLLEPSVEVVAAGLARNSNGLIAAVSNNVKRVYKLRKMMGHMGADIVVGMSDTMNVLLSLSAIGLKQTVVGSERSHPRLKATKNVWKILRKLLYARLDLSICLTCITADWLRENTMVRKVEVIPNGVVLPLKKGEPIVDVSDRFRSKNIIFSVGRLMPHKQFDHVIEVFSSVASDYQNWILIIAGEGPEREKLQKLIESKGLEEQVYLLGHVGNLGDWYSVSSVFLFLSSVEGFPNCLLEAMAHELACITYDCETGPSDLIDPSINGELIQLNNKQQATDSLNRVLFDSEFRRKLGVNAGKVKQENSMEMVCTKWIEALKRIV